ncbi:hypothetical protein [Streptomyces liangshanensis]|uniref:Cytochrome C oxidase subunit I n=1 Tax=Streptomyces liangshanensis TaxID=2717324 RepID=A0A6G9H749_9ACTN|nr:hypothetical protein [Streptomyces liangshanensis]QIQ06274.1 hypothetical protein HA039_31715 [Streptomyces liangshanensis]
MRPEEDSVRGLVQLEGYLLWSAEIEEIHRQAALFTARLPWLTTAQREDVERVYTADRIEVSRAVLVRITERAHELRGEYTERYERLRARCVAAALVAAGAATGTCAAFTLLVR